MKQKKLKPSVSVLIPAFNEEKNIQKIVRDCLRVKRYNIEVMVLIDKKTSDNTEEVAKKTKAKVIAIGNGIGKGELIRLTIPYLKTDFIVQIDADYQFLPDEITKLIEPLLKGFDITLGTRYQKGANVEKGSVSILKKIGSYALSFTTSIFARQRITDVMAGFKAFKTGVLKDLAPKTNHFGYEAELVIKAAQKKYKILNVPITYKRRISGNSSIHHVKHGLLVLGTILKTGLKIN